MIRPAVLEEVVRRRRARGVPRCVTVLLVGLVIGTGCVSRDVSVYSRSVPAPPLAERRVATLPTLAQGEDVTPALAARRTADRVLDGTIGGVTFHAAADTMSRLEQGAALIEALRGKIRDLRASSAMKVDGGRELLVAEGAVRGRGDDPSPRFRIRRASPAPERVFPASVDVALLAGIDAEYLLASVATTRFVDYDDVFALFGVLPLGWESRVRSHPSVLVYALYETGSGRRVWEGRVGSMRSPGRHVTSDLVEPIDVRAHPVVGVAYLLTGDASTVLERAIDRAPR